MRALAFACASLALAAVEAATGDQALLASQPERVVAAVERLASQEPGVTDVFFVGFAGHGGQSVFRSEATFARDAFARRYGSAERSVLLVNDVRDRESFPLATRTNLRHALRLIGERMDLDQDVLVLVLTSHGTAEEGLEVSNGDLPLASLRPSDLRTALVESAIRWRVVIASACFAGVFIPPLRDASTLIVTAADAKNSSFGCEDDRELTWFGEAFLRDALPQSVSIETAFVRARRIIEQRERAEGVERSRPQLHVGDDIRAKLRELDAVEAAAQGEPGTQVD
jgi:hypothetical protein